MRLLESAPGTGQGRRSQTAERRAAGRQRGLGAGIDAVRGIRQGVPDDTIDRSPVGIVEQNHATDLEHTVQVIELDHHLVEGVPPVNECELDRHAVAQEFRQRDLRSLLFEVQQLDKTGVVDVPDANSPPLGALKGIEDDVPPGCIEQRR
jgi:hypothetical protein